MSIASIVPSAAPGGRGRQWVIYLGSVVIALSARHAGIYSLDTWHRLVAA
jgi:hypothetical protein